jgi:hypothetical protein
MTLARRLRMLNGADQSDRGATCSMAKLGSFLREVGAFVVFWIVLPALLAPSAGLGAVAPIAFWLAYVWMSRTEPVLPASPLPARPTQKERELLKPFTVFLIAPAYLVSLQIWVGIAPWSALAWIECWSEMVKLLKRLTPGPDLGETLTQLGGTPYHVLVYDHFAILSRWGALLSAGIVFSLTVKSRAEILIWSKERVPLKMVFGSIAMLAFALVLFYAPPEQVLFTVGDGAARLNGKSMFLFLAGCWDPDLFYFFDPIRLRHPRRAAALNRTSAALPHSRRTACAVGPWKALMVKGG